MKSEMKAVTVYLKVDQIKLLKQRAEIIGITYSALIRIMLGDALLSPSLIRRFK